MNIGLVLSGGGVRGLAHIGTIKALEENGIAPNIVSGSSAGAVVGALYCYGYGPEEMMEFFRVTPLFQINRFAFGKPGFIDTDSFYSDFKKYFPQDNFNSLKKTLFVTTVDLLKGDLRVFNSGELIRPLLASSAFPGLFSPVGMQDTVYADGGILDNFPLHPIKDLCDLKIGSYASPLDTITPESLKYSVNVLERAIRINYSERSFLKFSHFDLLVRPMELISYGLLDMNRMNEIYHIGYNCAIEAIKRLDADHPLRA
jgi:NTE family protein